MSEKKFEDSVLESVGKIAASQDEFKTGQQKILSDVTRIDADTKKALADLGKVQDNANTFATKLATVERMVRREAIAAFGDPIKRFTSDPLNAGYIATCARNAYLQQRTAVTGVDSGIGGAVIPQETAAAIYDLLLQYGQWNTLGVMPIGSRTQIVPLISVRPTAYWVAQGAQITEGAFTGTSVTLTIKEAAAWIPVARANIEDSEADLAGFVMEQLGQSVAYRMDWACFAADGTDDTTDGAFTGIASGGTAATAADGNTTVSALELADFVRCLTTVAAGTLQRPAKWWIHPQILAKICLVRDDNGRPIFQNALEAPAPGAIGSILGYPVVLTAAMPSTDSAGNVVACFGDPQAGAVGLRKDFEFARSDEFQFDYNRSAFRVIVRGGFVIKLATGFAKLTLAAA